MVDGRSNLLIRAFTAAAPLLERFSSENRGKTGDPEIAIRMCPVKVNGIFADRDPYPSRPPSLPSGDPERVRPAPKSVWCLSGVAARFYSAQTVYFVQKHQTGR